MRFCLRVLASETWKQAAMVRKRAVWISGENGRICLGCLWDLRGGCDHAVSLDQSHLSASLSFYCCCKERKKKAFLKINCWYQSGASPSSCGAHVWPSVHLLMWMWWAKPISSPHILPLLLYFAYNLIVLHCIHLILSIFHPFFMHSILTVIITIIFHHKFLHTTPTVGVPVLLSLLTCSSNPPT